MIYFDNAATTAQKPSSVACAVAQAINGFGDAGRGAHKASLDAGYAVFRVRCQLADLFGVKSPSRIAFMGNATEALNTAINGLVRPGERVVTTAASHNSVLRPLYRKVDEEGCTLCVVSHDETGALDYAGLDRALCPGTRLAVITHASNVTGEVYDIARIARLCRARGVLLLVDAAQTAGVIPIDMGADGIDLVAFTGHKSLYGPQGTGGLVVGEGIGVKPLKVGGSGTQSYDRQHPAAMPEHLEAGTLNAHGIAGLGAGLSYIEEQGVEALGARVETLVKRFECGARAIPGVRIIGAHNGAKRCGIVSLNLGAMDSAFVADALNTEFGICTRGGAHCAPLMHKALGTQGQGAVRFSFSSFNTFEEVDAGLAALAALA